MNLKISESALPQYVCAVIKVIPDITNIHIIDESVLHILCGIRWCLSFPFYLHLILHIMQLNLIDIIPLFGKIHSFCSANIPQVHCIFIWLI